MLNNGCLIIAEIGQNHQGSIDVAKQMILECKKAGANVVKFQKSNLKAKFNKKALDRIYDNKNSWGKTYREHKEYLEFSKDEFIELQKFAKDADILFTASGMDIPSFEFLSEINVPFFKIGSGDANNLELIEKVAKMGKLTVLSTGMNSMDSVKKSVELFLKYNSQLVLMQCTSSYPLPDDQVNLNVIRTFQKEFGDSVVIGYSGHEQGTCLTISAVAMGALVIERHVTLDKTMKGTDHSASLDMSELKQLVEDVRRISIALGSFKKEIQPCETSCINKLGKSLVCKKGLEKYHKIGKSDLTVKVADPTGINPNMLDDIIGMVLNKQKLEDDSLEMCDLMI